MRHSLTFLLFFSCGLNIFTQELLHAGEFEQHIEAQEDPADYTISFREALSLAGPGSILSRWTAGNNQKYDQGTALPIISFGPGTWGDYKDRLNDPKNIVSLDCIPSDTLQLNFSFDNAVLFAYLPSNGAPLALADTSGHVSLYGYFKMISGDTFGCFPLLFQINDPSSLDPSVQEILAEAVQPGPGTNFMKAFISIEAIVRSLLDVGKVQKSNAIPFLFHALKDLKERSDSHDFQKLIWQLNPTYSFDILDRERLLHSLIWQFYQACGQPTPEEILQQWTPWLASLSESQSPDEISAFGRALSQFAADHPGQKLFGDDFWTAVQAVIQADPLFPMPDNIMDRPQVTPLTQFLLSSPEMDLFWNAIILETRLSDIFACLDYLDSTPTWQQMFLCFAAKPLIEFDVYNQGFASRLRDFLIAFTGEESSLMPGSNPLLMNAQIRS